MGYDAPDVYNQPEKFGLEQVASIDYSSGSYEFDERIVWFHKESGKFYMARDSGCSCPSPFENYDSLEKLSPFNLEELENEVKEETRAKYEGDTYDGSDPSAFLIKIRELGRP